MADKRIVRLEAVIYPDEDPLQMLRDLDTELRAKEPTLTLWRAGWEREEMQVSGRLQVRFQCYVEGRQR